METTRKVAKRLAGVALLLLGLGLTASAGWLMVRQLGAGGPPESSTRLAIGLLSGVGIVLLPVGFRLATNRPNKYRSILPPGGWYVLAFLLGAVTVVFIAVAIQLEEPRFLNGVFAAGVLGGWCWTLARRARADFREERALDEPGKSRSGYFRLVTLRGIPVFIHVSLPVGGVILSAFAGLDAWNSIYYCIGYVLLVGGHEAGHALAAVLVGIRVSSIDITGVGGLCRIDPPRKVWHGAVIYSAGIGVQLVILAAALIYGQLAGLPTSPLGRSLFMSFTVANGILLLLNLLPMRVQGLATDGAVLWQLLRHALGKQSNPFAQYVAAVPAEESPVFSTDTELLSIPALVPKNFEQGIEILNDRTTSMEVVTICLMRHVGLEAQDALRTMVEIHNNGGILIALESRARAEEVAAAITAEARQHGHPLVCRAVTARASSLESALVASK